MKIGRLLARTVIGGLFAGHEPGRMNAAQPAAQEQPDSETERQAAGAPA